MQNPFEMMENAGIRRVSNSMCLFCFLLLQHSSLVECNVISATFESNFALNHLAVNNMTGVIYIGAVNRLFQMSENLTVEIEYETGPKKDNAKCYSKYNFSTSNCEDENFKMEDMEDTSNQNQVLAVDIRNDQLVVCGTLYHGACTIRNLTNISIEVASEVFCLGSNNHESGRIGDNPMIGVVAPGPTGKNLLYLATASTDATRTAYLQTSCQSGVCRLPLDRQNTFVISDNLAVKLTKETGVGYKITYVSAFDINGYVYFLTRQPPIYKSSSSSSSSFISKIVRLCQRDNAYSYNSYVETQIMCGESRNLVQSAVFSYPGLLLASEFGIGVEDLVLFGVFSNSASYNSICFYPHRNIRHKFTENIQACYNNSGLKINDYFDFPYTRKNCQTAQEQNLLDEITDSFCGHPKNPLQNGPLNGTIPLSGTQLQLNITSVDLKLTAIQETTVNNHTVLILGTSDGQLLKTVIVEGGVVQQYDSILLDRSGSSDKSINRDLVFSGSMTHVYAMTKSAVYKVQLFECEKFQSCTDCLSSMDPYCGWCTLEARCSTKMDCENNDVPERWVFPSKLGSISSCPVLSDTTVMQVEVSLSVPVIFYFHGLPPPETDEHYSCSFGSDVASSNAEYTSDQLACFIPENFNISVVGSQSIDVAFHISSSNVSFMNIFITLYNCSSFTGCSWCTGTPFNCHWCIESNTCQHQEYNCSHQVNNGLSDSCPRVLLEDEEVLIVSGSQQELLVSVANLPDLLAAGADNFRCELDFSPRKSLPASTLNGTHISCGRSQFESMEKQPTTVPLTVVWGEKRFSLDGNIKVIVYNCSALSEGDCSICLSLSRSDRYAKFNCSWCRGACQPSSDCVTPEDSCPEFYITEISPKRVPKDGGSPVTISGINLGSAFDQVTVKINGTKCRGIEERYKASREYVFIMNDVATTGSVDITISVTNKAERKTITATDPELYEMTPLSGPRAGGTLVTISGKDLLSGTAKTIELCGTKCIYDTRRSTDTHLLCLTTRSNNQSSSNLTVVKFDSAVRTLGQCFEFTTDPTIDQIMPDGSFGSGGCMITVNGTNLDKSLGCVVTVANTPVQILSRNSSHITFISPVVNKSNLTSFFSSVAIFQLDAVNLTTEFRVYPNPVFKALDSTAATTGNTLYLQGSELNNPCMLDEIVIKIGGKICQITDHTAVALYCIVPALPPDNDPEVVVTAGGNLVLHLGRLRRHPGDTWRIPVGIVGGVSSLVLLIIVVIFAVKRNKSKRNLRRLEQQYEMLDKTVRDQCRHAFAEFHFEVSDFKSDLEQSGIPFWDFKTYAYKLLFPKPPKHPVLTLKRKSENVFGGFDKQMEQFNQLLSSQVFILIFIDVLDNQVKSFRVTDRVRVSSLLGIILLNRMEYATEIIKVLLGELIKRSIDKKTPKLMLRSTESLVEKLLANWLSLSMFEYLGKSAAGKALFMLFKALKHQIEKGPIDATTTVSKYTLSEDRLLRETIEPTVLKLRVFEDDRCVPCKMLSSDSISQAKEKALDALYRNFPHSKRPLLGDVSLAWRTGTEQKMLSNDNSLTATDGWRRINTLEYYQIPDDAELLLYKKLAEDSMEAVDEFMSLKFGQTLRPKTDNAKVWHLVKHEDDFNPKAPKVIPEIFLTHLLSTKVAVDKYIRELFEAIFRVDKSLPPVIKYLYDFLDKAAQEHRINDDDVVHTWKSNSLLLRFWVNMITNPGFVFDINQSDAVGSCLVIVAQAFIDSCSTQEIFLGKNSPSTKLLFAKDIPHYRKLVQKFFTDIQNLPPVSDKVIETEMMQLSERNETDFNLEIALRELYSYADKFKVELTAALSSNQSAKLMRLLEQFQEIQQGMDDSEAVIASFQ